MFEIIKKDARRLMHQAESTRGKVALVVVALVTVALVAHTPYFWLAVVGYGAYTLHRHKVARAGATSAKGKIDNT